ncbi:hypothetical protein FRC06_003675, partial [Ceratobasidium sp. 370]
MSTHTYNDRSDELDEDLGEIGDTEGKEIKYPVTSYQGWLKEAIKVAGLVQYYKLDTGMGKEIAAQVGMLTSNNQFHTT